MAEIMEIVGNYNQKSPLNLPKLSLSIDGLPPPPKNAGFYKVLWTLHFMMNLSDSTFSRANNFHFILYSVQKISPTFI